MTEDIRDAELQPVINNNGLKRPQTTLKCPECDHTLPLCEYTECDQCGAHLRLKVSVEAPAIGE